MGDNLHRIRNVQGYTLVEIVVVVLIISVLSTVSMRSLKGTNEVAKVEKTKQTLSRLAHAIAGDPDLYANGMRVDFGYVGDNGALPPNLDALVNDPGLGTWDGPYVQDELSSGGPAEYFRKDAWGRDIAYSGVALTSTGGGSSLQRSVARSAAELLDNTVIAVVTDLGHTPPGAIYKDSVRVTLSYPDGAGGITNPTKYPSANGTVVFDAVPVGLHDFKVVYFPTADTIEKKICIEPGQDVYTDVSLFRKVW